MRWLLRVMAIAVAGALVGVVAALAVGEPAQPPGPTPTATPTEQSLEPAPVRPPDPQRQVLLVWTPRSLPPGLAQTVRTLPRVNTVTVVQAGRVDLLESWDAAGTPVDRLRPGWAIPLDAFAVDPATYARLLPASGSAAVKRLDRTSAVLGQTSARLRGLEPGDSVVVGPEERFTVSAVVDDTFVGGAELVISRRAAAAVGISTPRFMLVGYNGPRGRMEKAIRRSAGPGFNARIRAPGETPYLRHGDAVLPQSLVKATFGEFSYRPPSPGPVFTQDPGWIARNLVTGRVPILGMVHCHRALIPALRGALGELRDEGLAHLVSPGDYAGCWNARLVSQHGGVSRHAWGAAVDLNAGANPTGTASSQDRRLVGVMEKWGFTWGGFWLVPDGMHFEYVGPPPGGAGGP